jgi:hypothetical protein
MEIINFSAQQYAELFLVHRESARKLIEFRVSYVVLIVFALDE